MTDLEAHGTCKVTFLHSIVGSPSYIGIDPGREYHVKNAPCV